MAVQIASCSEVRWIGRSFWIRSSWQITAFLRPLKFAQAILPNSSVLVSIVLKILTAAVVAKVFQKLLVFVLYPLIHLGVFNGEGTLLSHSVGKLDLLLGK